MVLGKRLQRRRQVKRAPGSRWAEREGNPKRPGRFLRLATSPQCIAEICPRKGMLWVPHDRSPEAFFRSFEVSGSEQLVALPVKSCNLCRVLQRRRQLEFKTLEPAITPRRWHARRGSRKQKISVLGCSGSGYWGGGRGSMRSMAYDARRDRTRNECAGSITALFRGSTVACSTTTNSGGLACNSD